MSQGITRRCVHLRPCRDKPNQSAESLDSLQQIISTFVHTLWQRKEERVLLVYDEHDLLEYLHDSTKLLGLDHNCYRDHPLGHSAHRPKRRGCCSNPLCRGNQLPVIERDVWAC